jgi:hypothetical protein
MTEAAKRKAIEEFFVAPKPRYSWMAIGAGTILGLVGLVLSMRGDFLAGAAVMALGGAGLTFLPVFPTKVRGVKQVTDPTLHFSLFRYSAAKQRFDRRVSATQIQVWLYEDIARIEESSRVAIGLLKSEDKDGGRTSHGQTPPQRDTMTVIGTLDPSDVIGFDPAIVRCRRIGDTDAYLYSTWRVVISHFTDHFLGVHQTTYNMIKNAAIMDEISECGYRDAARIEMSALPMRRYSATVAPAGRRH